MCVWAGGPFVPFQGRCRAIVVIGHYTAVTKTWVRLEMEMKEDKEPQKVVQGVMSFVKT
jgi:hypothetical protein